MKRFTKTNPYLSQVNEFLIDSPLPANINYFYGIGSILGLNLVVLIITGITLAMDNVQLKNILYCWNLKTSS